MSLYSSEIEIKIPFYDLDPMNIVWHGNYIKYLESSKPNNNKKGQHTF